MKTINVLFCFVFIFFLMEAEAQENKPGFIYQFFPVGVNSSDSGKQDLDRTLIQNMVRIRYLGYYDSNLVRIDQVTDGPSSKGLKVRNENELSIFVSLTSDSIFIQDSNSDSLVNYKLLAPEIKPTNKQRIISGFPCQQFVYRDFELWFSEGLPFYVNLGMRFRNLNKGLVAISNKKFGEIRLVEFSGLSAINIALPDLPKKIIKDSLNPLLASAE